VRRIGESCDELERLAEANPELVGRVTRGAEEHKDAYLRLKARLELADAGPRCRWVKQDGTACRSPQMKKHIYCFAHRQMMEARALALSLPAQEDANAIQIGIMRIQKALIEDTISTKKAGLLLYSMQLALQNVGQTTFGQAKTEELVTETVDEEEAIGENQHLPRRHGDTEESKGLPLINAEDRRLDERARPMEWKPPAEMFRMDTREGIEAYEASFRMKLGLGERTSPKTEKDRSWVELPGAATESEPGSGYCGAPSTSLGISPADGAPADRLNFGAPSLAPPLRLAQDDKGVGSMIQPYANLG